MRDTKDTLLRMMWCTFPMYTVVCINTTKPLVYKLYMCMVKVLCISKEYTTTHVRDITPSTYSIRVIFYFNMHTVPTYMYTTAT